VLKAKQVSGGGSSAALSFANLGHVVLADTLQAIRTKLQ
jgi:hypothetical protein